jgi:hypothetical protein
MSRYCLRVQKLGLFSASFFPPHSNVLPVGSLKKCRSRSRQLAVLNGDVSFAQAPSSVRQITRNYAVLAELTVFLKPIKGCLFGCLPAKVRVLRVGRHVADASCSSARRGRSLARGVVRRKSVAVRGYIALSYPKSTSPCFLCKHITHFYLSIPSCIRPSCHPEHRYTRTSVSPMIAS